MYSQKLRDQFAFIRQNESDQVKAVAIFGCEKRIAIQSERQACFRCEAADFFMTWRPLPEDPDGDNEWVPVLGRCGKSMALPSDEDGALLLPLCSCPYCTAMVIKTH